MIDDAGLMQLSLQTSYTYDERGRMVRANDPDGRPAPRLLLARTVAGFQYRFGQELPDDVVNRLTALIEREPAGHDFRTAPAAVGAILALLAAAAPITGARSGPAYRFAAAMV